MDGAAGGVTDNLSGRPLLRQPGKQITGLDHRVRTIRKVGKGLELDGEALRQRHNIIDTEKVTQIQMNGSLHLWWQLWNLRHSGTKSEKWQKRGNERAHPNSHSARKPHVEVSLPAYTVSRRKNGRGPSVGDDQTAHRLLHLAHEQVSTLRPIDDSSSAAAYVSWPQARVPHPECCAEHSLPWVTNPRARTRTSTCGHVRHTARSNDSGIVEDGVVAEDGGVGDQGVQCRVRWDVRQSRGRLAPVRRLLDAGAIHGSRDVHGRMLRNGSIGRFCKAVVANAHARHASMTTSGRARDGPSRVMTPRGARRMARVDSLDNRLGICAVVRLDHRDRIVAKDRLWRVCEGIEVGTLG